MRRARRFPAADAARQRCRLWLRRAVADELAQADVEARYLTNVASSGGLPRSNWRPIAGGCRSGSICNAPGRSRGASRGGRFGSGLLAVTGPAARGRPRLARLWLHLPRRMGHGLPNPPRVRTYDGAGLAEAVESRRLRHRRLGREPRAGNLAAPRTTRRRRPRPAACLRRHVRAFRRGRRPRWCASRSSPSAPSATAAAGRRRLSMPTWRRRYPAAPGPGPAFGPHVRRIRG